MVSWDSLDGFKSCVYALTILPLPLSLLGDGAVWPPVMLLLPPTASPLATLVGPLPLIGEELLLLLPGLLWAPAEP